MNPFWNLMYTLPKIGIQDLDIELDEAIYCIERHNADMEQLRSRTS
jgi:hypothetical protein